MTNFVLSKYLFIQERNIPPTKWHLSLLKFWEMDSDKFCLVQIPLHTRKKYYNWCIHMKVLRREEGVWESVERLFLTTWLGHFVSKGKGHVDRDKAKRSISLHIYPSRFRWFKVWDCSKHNHCKLSLGESIEVFP